MDTQQITAPPCAPTSASGGGTPSSGVIHVNVRHTAGFTVVGNHLSQHRGLSLVAIGLAVHIQSLPAGAGIGIKVLVSRFPDSESRIAAALRELEATGYLHRSRVRLPSGRITTRTVSYNRPDAGASTPATHAPQTRPRPGTPAPQPAPPPAVPVPAPAPPLARTSAPVPAPHTVLAVAAPHPVPAAPAPHAAPAVAAPQPAPVLVPAPTARRTPPPPLPQPRTPTPELHRAAGALLADLRRYAPQLVLSEGDIDALAPGVTAWLERDAHPDTVRHALTADLPVPLKHPARLLRHRITTLLPPPLPGAQDLSPARRGVIVIPLQNCDRCDRAFRAREPGHCRDCRTDSARAA